MKSHADRLPKYSGYLYTRKARAKSNMTLFVQYFLLSKNSTLLFNRHTSFSKLRYLDETLFSVKQNDWIYSNEQSSHKSFEAIPLYLVELSFRKMLLESQKRPFVHGQSYNQEAISGLSYFIKEPDRLFNPASIMTGLICVLVNRNGALKWYSITHELYYAKRCRFLEAIFHVVKNAAILTSQILVSRWITLALYWTF